MSPLLLLCFIFSCFLLSGSNAQIQNIEFGQVYNLTFDADYMYFQVFIPYNPVIPTQLRTAILTYVPYETLNVSASFSDIHPNYTNNEYYGTDKDGNVMRGVVWIDDIPKTDATLYISVSKFSLSDPVNIFGLNIEWPVSILDFPKEARYEAQVTVQPWQTKWFLLNFDDSEQYMSAVRAEFCDETLYPVSFSIVFPEVNTHSDSEVINPCGCTDVFIEERDYNIFSGFFFHAIQMFILPATVTAGPLYGSLFYAGASGVPNLQDKHSRNAQRACATRTVRTAHQPRTQQRTQEDPDTFTARLSLYGQELYPTVMTKYTKPDKINNDLITNIDDTPYCDFWTSDNFTGYFSPYQFYSIDAACFLETHADEFQVINFETLVGGDGIDEERVLIIHDYYKDDEGNKTTYFNIVHSNEACGSYAYFNAKVPTKGWEEEVKTKEEWTPLAIILTVVFGFLFAVFFIATILLVSRLREFSRYNKIPH